jgi:hypothetical protein
MVALYLTAAHFRLDGAIGEQNKANSPVPCSDLRTTESTPFQLTFMGPDRPPRFMGHPIRFFLLGRQRSPAVHFPFAHLHSLVTAIGLS